MLYVAGLVLGVGQLHRCIARGDLTAKQNSQGGRAKKCKVVEQKFVRRESKMSRWQSKNVLPVNHGGSKGLQSRLTSGPPKKNDVKKEQPGKKRPTDYFVIFLYVYGVYERFAKGSSKTAKTLCKKSHVESLLTKNHGGKHHFFRIHFFSGK
jgi:hypothetical protein